MVTARPTRARLRVLALLFGCVVIAYMDRANVSVAGTAISASLGLSPVQLGLIFSAFGWAYAALQIPGGMLTNVVRPRVLYTLALVTWSGATMLQGVAGGFASLFGLRLVTGAGEAPAYPINNRVVTQWFPDHERASAIATYTSGQYLGLALLTPAMAVILHWIGWRGLFVVTGLVGVTWSGIWFWLYRDPRDHARVNEAELEIISRGGGLIDTGGQARAGAAFDWRGLGQVFRYRKLWGLYLGQFSITTTQWFFLTWFPTYLQQYRGIAIVKTGVLAAVPFLGAAVGILTSGFLSDYLTRRGVSAGVARKMPILIGLALSVSIIGANFVDRTAFVILFMALAFFGNGMASIAWVFVSLLAPRRLIGLTGGVFNFFGNLPGIVVPVVIGYLVRGGNFAPALVFVGAFALIGIASYVFLVGTIERIAD